MILDILAALVSQSNKNNLRLNPDRAENIEYLREIGGANNAPEVFNEGIEALKWMIRNMRDGGRIAAVDSDGKIMSEYDSAYVNTAAISESF